MFFKKKDRKLGVAQGKRVYDLPLNKDQGTGFLILLVTLMTFLAVMALGGAFTLGSMTKRWSSGLENKLTIEIRAEDSRGDILLPKEIQEQAEEITAVLSRNPMIESAQILGEQEIKDLISPWLGEDIVLRDIPLPGLISVQLTESTPAALKVLEDSILEIAPTARLDTHEDWLNDLLKLTDSLRFAAIAITLLIGATTIAAVAGAIRSRMEVHKSEVELLHFMGARDDYITKQFQRHAFILTLQGSTIGTLIGLLSMTILWLMSGDTTESVIPELALTPLQLITLTLLPALVCGISAFTARTTVLRVLAQMP